MSTKLAVIGANGKVASLLIKRLAQLKSEFDTTAFIRNSDQAPKFESLGIKHSTAIDISNTSLKSVTQALKGFDAVVFSAGSGGKGLDTTFTVDLDGAVKVAEAVKANKIKKFILVSAIKADDRDFWWDSGLRSYYIAKKYADEAIKPLDIDWTILQPGWLLDTESTGKISDPSTVNAFAETINIGTDSAKISVPRDDVAIAIIESLRSSNSAKKVIPLISGDIPIAEAIKSLK